MKNLVVDFFNTVIGLSVYGALFYGWLANFYQMVSYDYEFALFSLKAVGVFIAPLGSILGLIGAV